MAPRLRAAAALFFAAGLGAGSIEGRVVDEGGAPLAGVRVYPDRPRHVHLVAPPPEAVTDAEGRFRLEVDGKDRVLCVEKDGWQRDLVPEPEWRGDIRLRPAPEFRVEKALVVRLGFAKARPEVPDGVLRHLLFSREPGVSSAANYLYEVSKGSLVLEEGAWRAMEDPNHSEASEPVKEEIADTVLLALKGQRFGDLDRVDNRTGARRPDGKPDHLWIFCPGKAQAMTADPHDLQASSLLRPLPWKPSRRWSALVMAETVPLGNIVHEAFHEMGEDHVDDLYLDCDDPETAGIWDLMDIGMYRGWDRNHHDPPWQEDSAYSPSHPGAWVRRDLWYYGRFRDTVGALKLAKGQRSWTGWIRPLERAPGRDPQQVVVPDPQVPGAFWTFEVRRPWGFDGGRVGFRWGPGYEGLVVAHVDPDLISVEGDPQGPERVLDAHPHTPEPPAPRFPCGRYELDDAAFDLGPGENPRGSDGPLSFQVLDTDPDGRMEVRIELAPPAPRRRRR
ncbi:MAG TPA: carboxypeptidase-like regulatory domain-containing protein [Holophagaceae bacterium]|nr:carboxypeptidase-like regulatory domain-containing protein [Holophagaceae bacterium]